MNHAAPSLLKYSMFGSVLFPNEVLFLKNSGGGASSETQTAGFSSLFLKKIVRFEPPMDFPLLETPYVLFDVETTGLDFALDRVIELGAIKISRGKIIDEFWTFVSTDIELTPFIVNLSGITNEMLAGQPTMDEVLPQFLDFVGKNILVAHNADFDYRMMKAAGERLGYEWLWPCVCTLKLSRKFLPSLERHNLDTLAQHFQLKFETRHRAIGDVKVMKEVFEHLLRKDTHDQWKHLIPYCVS